MWQHWGAHVSLPLYLWDSIEGLGKWRSVGPHVGEWRAVPVERKYLDITTPLNSLIHINYGASDPTLTQTDWTIYFYQPFIFYYTGLNYLFLSAFYLLLHWAELSISISLLSSITLGWTIYFYQPFIFYYTGLNYLFLSAFYILLHWAELSISISLLSSITLGWTTLQCI
jgi:hypothetical protein